MLLAFHNDTAIKAAAVAILDDGLAGHHLVQGMPLWDHNHTNDGCGVVVLTYGNDDAARCYREAYGLPESLMWLTPAIFEYLPADLAPTFSRDLIASVPVGADLSDILDRLLYETYRDHGCIDEDLEADQPTAEHLRLLRVRLAQRWVQADDERRDDALRLLDLKMGTAYLDSYRLNPSNARHVFRGIINLSRVEPTDDIAARLVRVLQASRAPTQARVLEPV